MSEAAEQSWRVRKLAESDVEATAKLLARSFSDNPAYEFMHPRTHARGWDLERFFFRNLTWRLHLDLTWVTVDRDGRVRGTATLEPPGGVPHSFVELVRHWLLPTLREQGPQTALRIARTDAAFARTYRTLGSAPRYWHVHAVAVDAPLRGLGVGTQMLRHVLGELDGYAEDPRVPTLLSTQRERNVGLYQKVGFELLASVSFNGYRSWFMRRRP